jgi:hypothetical protein
MAKRKSTWVVFFPLLADDVFRPKNSSWPKAALKWLLALTTALFPFYFLIALPLAHFKALPPGLGFFLQQHQLAIIAASWVAFWCLIKLYANRPAGVRIKFKQTCNECLMLFVLPFMIHGACFGYQGIMNYMGPKTFLGLGMAFLAIFFAQLNSPKNEQSTPNLEKNARSVDWPRWGFYATLVSGSVMIEGVKGHVDMWVAGVVMASCVGLCILGRTIAVSLDGAGAPAPAAAAPAAAPAPDGAYAPSARTGSAAAAAPYAPDASCVN